MTNPTVSRVNGSEGGINGSDRLVICTVEHFLQLEYDYLVVGGGTAGLVLAARLSENPNVQVGVLEAGKNRMEDIQVTLPALFTKLLSNPEYDWMYTTAPQVRLWLSEYWLTFVNNQVAGQHGQGARHAAR